MKFNSSKLLVFISFILMCQGCNKQNRFAIDTSKSDTEVNIKRVDIDVIDLDTLKIESQIESLFEKYPEFMQVYFSEILDLPLNDRSAQATQIKSFLNDSTFRIVNAEVKAAFMDVSDIEKKLSQSYAYIQYYFPEIKLPAIYFFVSGFNRSVVITPQFVGIGTDMYLGSDYPRYADVSYEYMTYNMRRESIAIDVISSILFSNFYSDVREDRLLDNMLYRGKIMYVLSVIMPEELPHDIMGYNKFQWEWSRKYEEQIWNTILDKGDLYSTNHALVSKYLNDAPFTTPVSQESPGRLGTWVGWQIVNAYMDKNKNVTLPALIKENNYQKILDQSAYRP